jgi:hypothetical protein
MPITILSIEKSGSIKEHELKTYEEAQLYKKAGFKSAEGFELQTEWGAEVNNKKYSVSVYGKTNGRAGQENKYEFPPPIDNTLFFGACVLVNKENGEPNSITKDEWKLVYDHLYGGFEDIGDEDSAEDSEDDVSDTVPRTKEGYVKDDFIVDDDEEDEDFIDDDSDITESSEEIKSKKKAVKKPVKKVTKVVEKEVKKEVKEVKEVKKTAKKTVKEPETVFTKVESNEDSYLECTSELEEEEYV